MNIILEQKKNTTKKPIKLQNWQKHFSIQKTTTNIKGFEVEEKRQKW